VPDVYQGQELIGFALVDPDNRRPVDYDERRRVLASLDDGSDSIDPKLLVTSAALRLRQQRRSSFSGPYSPIPASGAAADHVVAFARGDDVVTVATRLPMTLRRAGGWRDTTIELPQGTWRDVLSGERVDAATAGSILRHLPVALLVREEEDTP